MASMQVRKMLGHLWTGWFVAGLFIGCSKGPNLGDVEGRVTLDGQPLAWANIMFLSAERGRPGSASTNIDGRYVLRFTGRNNGAPIGEHEVKIWTYQSPYVNDQGKTVSSPERLPKRYHEKTELRVRVVPGKNIHDFDLTSQPDSVETQR